MTTRRWRCVLVGGEALLRECGDRLLSAGHGIAAVVTRQPATLQWASSRGIPGYAHPDDLRSVTPFDLLFSIANLKVLRPDILKLARRAAINFHDGPLPERAGLNAPVWAILEGADRHGVTWHRMTEAADAGPILRRHDFEIRPTDTALTLNARCFEQGLEAFASLLDDLAADRLEGEPQRRGFDRYHGRADRPPAGCVLDLSQPAEALLRLGRALDFGNYANPIGLPKLWTADGVVGVRALASADGAGPSGTVLHVEEQGIVIAAGRGSVRASEFVSLEGEALSPPEAARRLRLRPGDVIAPPSEELATQLGAWHRQLAPFETMWIERLQSLAPLALPAHHEPASGPVTRTTTIPATPPVTSLTLVAAVLGRVLDQLRFDAAWDNPRPEAPGVARIVTTTVPLRVSARLEEPFQHLAAALESELGTVARATGWMRDLHARTPGLARTLLPGHSVGFSISAEAPIASRALDVVIHPGGERLTWRFDPARVAADWVARLEARFLRALEAVRENPATPVGDLPLLLDDEQEAAGDAMPLALLPSERIHDQVARAAAGSPSRAAVQAVDETLTYAELMRRADRLAGHLMAHGVRRGDRVGVALPRTSALPIALLAVLRAGAAYVPLDPEYPEERLQYIARDAGLVLVLAEPDTLPGVAFDCPRLSPRIPEDTAREAAGWPPGSAEDLAYVLYTSGSTGHPKGVQVEHRQVTSFFAAMDRELGTEPGCWLAVTSLSFDISVLELLWTLARGYSVVLHPGVAAQSTGRAPATATRPLGFSLFYFASAGETADYRLLLEGARFADEHGFEAVWVPERHFHAFGGLFPNPAVAAAAVAAVTRNVRLRAGSVVLPLHHPVRVAEEWAMVDRLSGGRVGVSVASGWMPRDFVLRPEAYADAKQRMVESLDTVRRLWRGEELTFTGPDGRATPVRILPRPVQAELPVWITSAGNVETFELAGRLGVNVLTHLLGQSQEELAGKIAAYRAAWRLAGHPGEGHVTLMLHTFVGPDEAEVRARVRGPLKDYLRSSVNLIRPSAWAFPAFRRPAGASGGGDPLEGLSEAELDAVLEHAFERYYTTSGLFGTPAQCAETVARLRALGVDEIGCLVDFGIDTDTTLAHLPWLDQVRAEATRGPAAGPAEDLADAIARYHVTHLQCTPSLAAVLADSGPGRSGLARLRALLVGGDLLTPELAARLLAARPGTLLNMYGPTEATVWATVHRVAPGDDPVPIGRPLANTIASVVDARGRQVPTGTPGELVLGGHGVARGYLARPELTAERFPSNLPGLRGRAYRTGDRARRRGDGVLEFLGRLDAQVKIRGHRIEPGEIEAALRARPGVREAAVIAREDVPGDLKLAAYVVPIRGARSGAAEIRDQLSRVLPAYMVPSHVVVLDALPLTPNGKLDRRALPRPTESAEPRALTAPPAGGMEEVIARAWAELLGVASVGRHDNFFDLGGHSLLAIQAQRRMTEILGRDVSITDLFRFPTVASLVQHLVRGEDTGEVRRGVERGQRRLAALGRRGRQGEER